MHNYNDEKFEVESVSIDEGNTRHLIVRWLLLVISCFLIGAGSLGVLTGTFDSLSTVLIFAEAPIFTILGYYFGKD